MGSCRTFKQIKPEERVVIACLRLQGAGVNRIARVIGRAPSTVSRGAAGSGPAARPPAGLGLDAAARQTTLAATRECHAFCGIHAWWLAANSSRRSQSATVPPSVLHFAFETAH
ncbi:MAG: helix-turn-helix domain-containing protein [Rubrivivax sp.]|nr:helix-turn-helix domain-containing protein [Rubrivivax sp.]